MHGRLTFLSFHLQAMHNEIMSLKVDVQNLQAQISDQVSGVPFPNVKGRYVVVHSSGWHTLSVWLPTQTASQLILDQFQKRCVRTQRYFECFGWLNLFLISHNEYLNDLFFLNITLHSVLERRTTTWGPSRICSRRGWLKWPTRKKRSRCLLSLLLPHTHLTDISVL